MLSNPNEKGAHEVLAKHHVPVDLVIKKMNMYNECRELDKNE